MHACVSGWIKKTKKHHEVIISPETRCNTWEKEWRVKCVPSHFQLPSSSKLLVSCPTCHLLPSSFPLWANQGMGKLQTRQLYDRGECHKRQKAERGSGGSWWVIAPQTYTPGPGNWELLTGRRIGERFPQFWTCFFVCCVCVFVCVLYHLAVDWRRPLDTFVILS